MALDGATASFLPYTLNGLQDIAVNSSSVTSIQVNSLVPNRVVVSDSSNFLVSAGATTTEVDFLSGTTSNVQTQLNSKASTSYVDTNFVSKTTGSSQTMNGELQAPAFTATGRLAVNEGSQFYNARVESLGEDYIIQKDDSISPIETILRYDLSLSKWIFPDITASRVAIFDVDKGLVFSTVTPTTLAFLDIGSSLTSLLSLKANLAGPQTFTGTHTFSSATPINLSALTASRVLQLDASKNIQTSTVTTTELGFLSGVTSALQTQIDSRVLKAGDTMTGTLALSQANVIEFGNGVPGKEANAGKIGYQTFNAGCLDIVGAGTTNANRSVRIYDRLGVGVTPSTTFHVAGNSFLNGLVGVGITPETGVQLRLPNSVTNRNLVLFSSFSDDHRFYGMGINNFTYRFNIQDATTDRFGFFAGTGSTTSSEVFSVAGTGAVSITGNVGIGTAPSIIRALRIARSYTLDNDYQSMISFENTAVGAAFTHWEAGPNVFSGKSRFTIRGGTKNFNTLINLLNMESDGRTTLTGVLNVTGGNGYALPQGLTITPGSLILGDITVNYGGGWNAGIMMECLDTTEISVHDSNNRVVSFMFYSGNTFTIGRDIDYGVTPLIVASRLQCNGSVGIGTTNPATALHIARSITANADYSGMISFENTSVGYFEWQLGPQVIDNQAAFSLRGGADGFGSLVDVLTVIGGGGGIFGMGTNRPDLNWAGTAIPNAKLSILGGVSGQGGGSSRLSIGADNRHYSAIEAQHIGSGSTTLSFLTCASAFVNGSDPTTRMFINENGLVGIGTVSPTVRLDVQNNSTNCVIAIDTVAANQSTLSLRKNGVQKTAVYCANNSNDLTIFNDTAGSNVFTIGNGFARFDQYTSNGTLSTTSSNGTLAVSSDRRIKENIVYLSDTREALTSILNLKPATYNLIGSTGTYLGFIAQDIEEHIPLAIDGKKYEWVWEIDDNGKPKFDEEGNIIYKLDENGERIIRPRGVSDRAIIAVQTMAIQEQQRMIQEQQRMINEQSEKINEQSEKIQTLTERNEILEQHARKLESDFNEYRDQTDRRMTQLAELVKGLLSEPVPKLKRTKTTAAGAT